MLSTLSEKLVKISVIQGDITKIRANAIVNAAHHTLLGGGGVDGAIHRAAGKELLEECIKIKKETLPKGLSIGEVVITKGYNLPAKFVIHTVGPRYYLGKIDKLKNCYLNALKLAEENGCKSIAFPSIATGAYGTPIEKSAEIVKGVLDNYSSKIIEEVILVLYNQEDFDVYKKLFA